MATDQRVFAFMVAKATMRDRVYFCSDATAAKELGVCRLTILRSKKRLEAAGKIRRVGQHRFGPRLVTVK